MTTGNGISSMHAGSRVRSRRALVRLGCAILLALSLAVPPGHAAETEIRVIPLQHRLPDELIPVLQPLLGTGESIFGHDTKLIVKATPSTQAQIQKTLAELDVPRRNLRIQIQIGLSGQSLHQDLGVSGQYQNGSTRIIVTDGEHRNDQISARDAHGNQLNVQAERRVTTRRDANGQTLVVLDGGRASLRIGESIPQVEPFLALVGDRRTVAAGIQYYDVTTGFDAEPHLIGRQVRLRVNPRLAFRSNQGMQSISFEELQTEVMVPLAEWFDLGTILGNANTVNRQILGMDRSTDAGYTSLRIRIDPM